MRSKQFFILPVLAGVLFPFILVLSSCGQADNYYYGEVQEEGISQADRSVAEEQIDPAASEEKEEARSIYVQVCGAVRCPGVYELSPDARVYEAIELSGGLTEDAAAAAVNQAGRLEDGQMILVPTADEWAGQREAVSAANGSSDGQDDRVNINTADEALLQTIPGIGKARAQSIITYRQEHGEFATIEDIKKVSGIKDGLFQKIKDKIRV